MASWLTGAGSKWNGSTTQGGTNTEQRMETFLIPSRLCGAIPVYILYWPEHEGGEEGLLNAKLFHQLSPLLQQLRQLVSKGQAVTVCGRSSCGMTSSSCGMTSSICGISCSTRRSCGTTLLNAGLQLLDVLGLTSQPFFQLAIKRGGGSGSRGISLTEIYFVFHHFTRIRFISPVLGRLPTNFFFEIFLTNSCKTTSP